MKTLTRSKASVLNSTVATTTQAVQLIVQFIARSVFIYTLGSQYLGLNGLFTNILGYLNFAELGIGSAITFSLYKPLQENDTYQISSILKFFRNLYRIIAIVVLIGGLIVCPFIPNLIGGESSEIKVNIQITFLLALSNTVISYFTTYKRTLLIADQKGYINSINTVGYNVLGQILQIIFLFIWKDFYVYLIIQALTMAISNLRVSRVVDRMYPEIKLQDAGKVDNAVIAFLKKNITGMMSSKLGGIIVNGTDNLLLSYYVGLTAVGMYANYTMLVGGLTQIITQLVSAVTASIGNLGASDETKEKKITIFYQYFMVTSLIGLAVAVGFSGFSSAFVNLWIGKDMVYSYIPLTVISINFLLQCLRQSIINYTNAYGLYWYARWKPLFESIVNFIISWTLVKYTDLSITGVLLGTICSNIFINYWWESYIVLRYGLKTKISPFLRLYGVLIVFGSSLIFSTTSLINIWAKESLVKGIGVTILAEVFVLIGFLLIQQVFYPKKINKFNIMRFIRRTAK